MTRSTTLTAAALLVLALRPAALAGPTPPPPPGYAVVLEPSRGGDLWVLVPLKGDEGPRSLVSPPHAPAGYAVVLRPSRHGQQWVLVPLAPSRSGANAPPAPPVPHSPQQPEQPPRPPTPLAAAEPASPPIPPPPVLTAPPENKAQRIELEQEMVELINDARNEKGLPPLQPHPLLTRAARAHSQEMAELGYFDHVSPTPQNGEFTDRMRNAGVKSWGAAAENIAMGNYDRDIAEGLVKSWLESPHHRDNILNDRYVYTGIGVATHDGMTYATQLFTATIE